MNYAEIKKHDIANGPGVRTSLFVSGCTHKCKNCFNPETWDPEYGNKYTKETYEEIIESLTPPYISGLTLLGGDPLDYDHPSELLPLVRHVKGKMKEKTIWCFTGKTIEQILEEKDCHTFELLEYVDVLVDGPFIEELKDPMLEYRGSSNQRLIQLQPTLYWWKISGELKIHNA